MSQPIIQVEHLSKQYRLGEVGTGTLSHDLKRWWYKVRGKEDPFARIGEVNDRSTKGDSEYVWALKDINFSVQPGEVVGIIGRNGAGKSTLLKILSKTTAPTTGRIKVRGRIASLLEVGTGFHPELTGRENIYLNGAILGMTRKEINRQFDAIVDFAGVERYVDTPVKRYSSGIYVRLAFAVAAHLEPEILIVDEVLAVGDAEFQKKCLGKMKDVSVQDGRTVLFVSHNMGAIADLCNRTMVLKNGTIPFCGSVEEGINFYIKNDFSEQKTPSIFNNEKPNESDILFVQVINKNRVASTRYGFNEEIIIEIVFRCDEKYSNAKLGMKIADQKNRNIFTTQYSIKNSFRPNELMTCFVTIPKAVLVPNTYTATVALHVPNIEVIRLFENIVSFDIEETGTDFFQFHGQDYGCVFVNCRWDILK